MRYQELAETYNELEEESSTLQKTEILSGLFRKASQDEIEMVALLINGRVFPNWSQKKLDFGKQLIIASLSRVTGRNKRAVLEEIKNEGDVGAAAESLLAKKNQATLTSKKLTVSDVFQNLRKLADVGGEGSVDKKTALVSELLSSASPLEAKYISRTVTEELRIGVGEGVTRKAIASAFEVKEKAVEKAYALVNDYALVAKVVKEKGEKGLGELGMELGRPIKVMLAYKSESMEEALEKVGGKAAIEEKFDGFRVQIHVSKTITVFTRRLEDVTDQFPDIVEAAQKAVKEKKVILEGEAVGLKDGSFLPFQKVSRRIRRKYKIEEMAEKIPVTTFLFDIIYRNGENLLKKPFRERRKILEDVVEPAERMKVAEQLVTSDPEEGKKFYLDAVAKGLEGVMVKNLDSPYKPGSRVGHMLKLKPTMETLDLAVIGAEWGEGRRTSWLGSFILGVQTPDGLKPIGKMATGLTDSQFKEMTEKLKPLITSDTGKVVDVKPEVVVEVAYEEIQKSPNYESGYALRFPRMVRVREDKGVEEADDIERVERLYDTQKGKTSEKSTSGEKT